MTSRWVSAVMPRHFALAWAAGLVLAAATAVMAVTQNLPIRDPDAFIPGYIRMPVIVLGAILLDIVPRVVRRATSVRVLVPTWQTVVQERWPTAHLRFALAGMAAWYLCYAAFRNVKNMAPFVNDRSWERPMAEADRLLFAGHDPAGLLHQLLGTGITAHLLSAVYIVWIVLVPVTIAIALVWTRNTRAGEWYVTAVAVDWSLGALLYVLFPTLGPIYSNQTQFGDLPATYVSRLQEALWTDRVAVLADPWGSGTLQTIAAFASLHVGVMVTICLIAELIALPRWVRISAWVFLVLTCLSTVYLGWHFVMDVIGGAALGAFAVWIAGLATGNRIGWRTRLMPDRASSARPATLASRSAPPPDHPAVD